MNEMYYKRKEGKWVKTTKIEALEEDEYGIRYQKYGHIFTRHSNCEDSYCLTCELNICVICSGIEGGLTTHCCGELLDIEEIDKIYNGEKDFIFGEWVFDLVSEGMTWDPYTYKKNYIAIKEHFKEDIINNTEKGKEIDIYLEKLIKLWKGK